MAAAPTIVALACGDGDDGPAANSGAIQVALSSSAVAVNQGGTGSLNVALTRSGGFTGTVTLAVTGLPAGITAVIDPPQLSGTATTATINVAAAADIAPQTYSATVTATGPNVAAASATYQVAVAAAPNYALSATPAALTIPAGTSGSTTIQIARTNFTDAIAFQLLDPPSGITGAFSPTPSTTNMSTAVVSVAASVTPGNYPLTIRGMTPGPGNRTTTVSLTVTAAPTGGTRVEYEFCDPSDVPAFFAYQDGSGLWQRVVATTSGDVARFAFEIKLGRGGIMAVYRYPSESNADVYQTDVRYASATELAEDAGESCSTPEPTKTVSGTIAGVTAGQYGITSLGGVSRVFNGAAPTNPVVYRDVPAGPVDFVATRLTTPGLPPDKVVLLRNLDIPDGGSLPVTIDFNGPAATAPAAATATITGGGTDRLEIFTELITANGASLLWFDLAPSVNAIRPWAGIAPAQMVAGDFHAVVAFASPSTSETDFRVTLKYVGPVGNQSLAFGPTISTPTASLVSPGSFPRFRFQGVAPSEYGKGVFIDLQSSANAFSLVATNAYLAASGSATAYDFTTPDVAALPGFPAAARLTAGPNDVSTTAFGFNGPGIFELRPTLGSESRSATVGSRITVP
jgi:hypothetical protein